MKQLPLTNRHYINLIEQYKRWLTVIGYSDSTIRNSPSTVKELLFQLESLKIPHIRFVEKQHIDSHIDLISNRPSTRTSNKLSVSYINIHKQALKLFGCFLKEYRKIPFPVSHLEQEWIQGKKPVILTVEEMKDLYDLADNNPVGMRDKAMLSLYYGCGLRRNEGLSLELKDIDLRKKQVFVRKGKNYKERYIALADCNIKHLEQYIKKARPWLLNGNPSDKLLISNLGKPMSEAGLFVRLKALQKRSRNETLRKKKIGLHTLRHSIATHLLSNGMSIERIAVFLGHASIQTTQIYTHLVQEQNDGKL